jgi:hypothetical protein
MRTIVVTPKMIGWGVVALILLVVACLIWRSPSARAWRINARMNETPMGDEWFALLCELRETVDKPEEYLSYSGRGWVRRSSLVLAKRLLADKATALLPGITSILRTTKPRAWNDYDRQAAIAAIDWMGKAASSCTPVLIQVVQEDERNASLAMVAIWRIGEPAAAAIPILISQASRGDLDVTQKYHTAITLAAVLGLKVEECTRVLQNSDLYMRYFTAIALGRRADTSAGVALVGLLKEKLTSKEKDEVAKTLCAMPIFPDDAVTMLRDLETKDPAGNGQYATRVLQQRKAK